MKGPYVIALNGLVATEAVDQLMLAATGRHYDPDNTAGAMHLPRGRSARPRYRAGTGLPVVFRCRAVGSMKGLTQPTSDTSAECGIRRLAEGCGSQGPIAKSCLAGIAGQFATATGTEPVGLVKPVRAMRPARIR